jgi:isochorismate synthase
VLFASPQGATIAGWDAAEAITGDGHDLAFVRREAERAHRETVEIRHPDLPDAARRPVPWIGGHSFVPGPRTDPVWAGFPDQCFLTPRWTHRAVDGGATLALLLGPGEVVADATRVVAEYTSLVTGAGSRQRTVASPDHAVLPSGSEDRRRWLDGTRVALDAITCGDLSKVVLARHLDIALEGANTIDVVEALEDLGRRFPTCTRFLLSRAGADFFGATPETLVERRGGEVRADAMAGSCPRGDEATLRASVKDAREHALVVREIVARLRPYCDPLDVPPAATIRHLANVAHLWTPIRGQLARPAHVLELVAALHPTPAVAGTPTDAAIALLGRAEPTTRGWFAAPFGWFDAMGDGHFVVALRSCIRHARGVRLYAGAGIVRGSDPEREFDETVLKMRAVLDTLHAITDKPAERMG